MTARIRFPHRKLDDLKERLLVMAGGHGGAGDSASRGGLSRALTFLSAICMIRSAGFDQQL